MKYASRGMKKRKILLGLVAIAAMFGLVACKDTPRPTPNPPVEVTTFEVIFENNGHGAQPEKLTEVSKLPNPLPYLTEEGWNFEGWFYDAALTQKANVGEKLEKNTTLYAKWTEEAKQELQTITIAEALEICAGLAAEAEVRYIINAEVVKILNPGYGQMTIKDATGTIDVYGSYDWDGVKGYAELEDKPYAGDTVSLSCLLQNFNGTYEVKSAWILSFKHEEQIFDINEYTAMSIEEARSAKKDSKVIIEGVVAQITYATGKIPTGFYLVDDTNSIFVYDSQIAPRVKIGNKIKLAAIKEYWILADELASAALFGYEGCCQVSSGHLLENDGKTDHVFNKDWILDSTVKEMIDTPFSENVTTTIFKVNALVKKVDGHNFVNYYFYDIDGTTGSYTYTQCNGNDFDWLDEFDGKICTVYLSAMNAKASRSGCVWRFLPIEVKDEGYTFDLNKSAEFAVKYFGINQFFAAYNGNPELECIPSVSSELLGVKDVKLVYSSSDTNVISFDEVNGKIIMNAKTSGKATISVKASYNNIQYTESMEINVTFTEIPENTKTVKEVINIEPYVNGQVEKIEVFVRGIAGPSLANQTGFYLIDETGAIAIRTTSDTMKKISLGDEVVLKGLRTVAYKELIEGNYGQAVVTDCELVANLYGNHSYSTASFIKDKTIDDLYDISVSENATAQVYVVEAKIKYVEAQFYGNVYLVSPNSSKEIILYSSDGRREYSWLKAYNGQTLKVEVALCNWNTKKNFAACALSATLEDGTVLFNMNNYNK